MQTYAVPCTMATDRHAEPLEVKLWLGDVHDKNGWNISYDQQFSDSFADLVAERGSIVKIFAVSDMRELYDVKDQKVRHNGMQDVMRLTRRNLKSVAAEYSDVPHIELFEVYLNCLPMDIVWHEPTTRYLKGVKHAKIKTMFYPHYLLKDGHINVME